MKFNNFRIAQKLLLAFGAIVLVIVGQLRRTLQPDQVAFGGRSSEFERPTMPIDRIDQGGADVSSGNAAVRKFLMTGDEADKADVSKGQADFANDIASRQDRAECRHCRAAT